MKKTRLDLHKILCDILGSSNCYYIAPSKGMKYPCIKYNVDVPDVNYADNIPYINCKKYILTLITKNSDTDLVDKILELPYCSMKRSPYIADNLYHFVFELYF